MNLSVIRGKTNREQEQIVKKKRRQATKDTLSQQRRKRKPAQGDVTRSQEPERKSLKESLLYVSK